MTISLSDALHEKMKKWRHKLNFSRIFQDAVLQEITKKESFRAKLEEGKTLKEIWQSANLETPGAQYETGKELGFTYAKNAPYHEIKQYEQYAANWDKKEPFKIEQFHYELDIWSLLEEYGCFQIGEKPSRKLPKNAICITDSLDAGFMQGVIDFIREESTSVEVDRIHLQRDKKMFLAKGGKERLKVFIEHAPRPSRRAETKPGKKSVRKGKDTPI